MAENAVAVRGPNMYAIVNEGMGHGSIHASTQEQWEQLQDYARKHNLLAYEEPGAFGFILTSMEKTRQASEEFGISLTTKLAPGPRNGLYDGKTITVE